MKIRNRLALLFTGMVAALMLAFSLVIYLRSSRYREMEFYGRLREKAVVTARLLYEANQILTPQTMQMIEDEGKTMLFNEDVTVYEAGGKVVYHTGPAPQPFSPTLLNQLLNDRSGEIKLQQGDREFLYKLHKEPKTTLVVVVSAIDTYGFSKVRYLVGILAGGWIGSVIVAIAFGWVFSGRALAPINDVIGQVERIDPLTLQGQKVVAGQERDEIAQLAKTFNRMLVRIRRSFEAQRSFVSHASHELRTPLTVMKGQIQVALLQNRGEEEYRALLQSLGDDVSNLTALANYLLELAKTSADNSALPFEEGRVDEVVLQAEAELRHKYPEYRISVNYADTPEEETAYFLPLNERLLKNAFYNLMENACKFSPDQAVQVVIHLADEVTIDFIDQGPGIRREDQAYIFEPFFRSEETRKHPGHGIGLSLVKRIVELHQGQVQVVSQLGKGTVFTVVLPRLRKTSNLVAGPE